MTKSWPWIVLVGFILAGAGLIFFKESGPKPLPKFAHEQVNELQATNRIHQLLMVLNEYASENGGRFPPTLDGVKLAYPEDPDWRKRTTYIGGLTWDAPGDKVLIRFQPANGREGVVIEGLIDGSARRVQTPSPTKAFPALP